MVIPRGLENHRETDRYFPGPMAILPSQIINGMIPKLKATPVKRCKMDRIDVI
jgi:hypothetical protein